MCLTFFSLVRHVSHLFQFLAQTLCVTNLVYFINLLLDCSSVVCGWRDHSGSDSLCCRSCIYVWSRVWWNCWGLFCVLAYSAAVNSLSSRLEMLSQGTPPICAVSCKALEPRTIFWCRQLSYISYADIFISQVRAAAGRWFSSPMSLYRRGCLWGHSSVT